jgi:chitin disaccharide deacetylase
MAGERFLIVNADDLGLSEAVNAGIAEAHERGIVTSASLMVRQPAAEAAARGARRYPRLAIGLHIDLGQWDYESGEWKLAYERCSPQDEVAVETECRQQLDAFRELLGREPTHLDSHQHTHMEEPVAAVAERLAAELGVPLRGHRIRYEGGFYGQSGRGVPWPQGITVEHLVELIAALPQGWTELGCHPGQGVEETESSYGREREIELGTLCDERVRATLAEGEIELRSFAEVE